VRIDITGSKIDLMLVMLAQVTSDVDVIAADVALD
jgi:hypothetical protein